MSVRKREDRGGWWYYRRVVQRADGSKTRIQGKAPVNTKASAENAERAHVDRVLNPERFAVASDPKSPLFCDYAATFVADYAKVQNKPSEARRKERAIEYALKPHFEGMRLHEIKRSHVESLKAKLSREGGKDGTGRNPRTVNNIMTVLSKILNHALDLELIDSVPRFKSLKTDKAAFEFLGFDEYAALVDAARANPTWHLAVLLAGDAGLRRGEMMALRWDDYDRHSKILNVSRSIWRDHEGPTKSWSARAVPATQRLQEAIRAVRDLRSPRMIADPRGRAYKEPAWRKSLPRICDAAKIGQTSWHSLRHTFCSHLAMRGAPGKVIQELAGHSDLAVTMRYMHLTQGAKQAAIRLLESS